MDTVTLSRSEVISILEKIKNIRVCLIGDVCLDLYWRADMKKSRLSRETPHYPLPVVEETPVKDKQTWKTVLKLLLVVVVAVLVLLAVFTVVARMSPHLFDSILYSPEELEILNR